MDASTFRDQTSAPIADESEAEITRVFRPVDPRSSRRQSLIAQAHGANAAKLAPKGR